MKVNRIKWVDTAKGIGIILVAFGHLELNLATKYLNSFTMPLFFFCSGVVFNDQRCHSIKEFVSYNVRRLMYPYFLWGALLLIFWLVFERTDGSLIKNLAGFFFMIPGSGYMDWGLMMWFLPSLFITQLIYALILKFANGFWRRSFIVTGILIIGYLMVQYKGDCRCPFALPASLMLLFFLHVGFSFKNMNLSRKWMFFTPLLVLTWYFLVNLNGFTNPYISIFGNEFLFLVVGCLGVLVIVLVSRLLSDVVLFNLIGQNSLIIFLLHLKVYSFIKLIQVYLFGIPLSYSLQSHILYLIIAVSLILFLKRLIQSYTPWLYKFYEN